MNWSPERLDQLERAIVERSRVRLTRRGTEYVLVPDGLRSEFGSEILSATHPGTGDTIEIRLDDIDEFNVLY